jgi:hypothetical protein
MALAVLNAALTVVPAPSVSLRPLSLPRRESVPVRVSLTGGCAVAGKDHYLYSSASLVRRWVTLDPVHGRQLEAALASVHAVYLEQVRQARRNGGWLLAPAPCRDFAGEGSDNTRISRTLFPHAPELIVRTRSMHGSRPFVHCAHAVQVEATQQAASQRRAQVRCCVAA